MNVFLGAFDEDDAHGVPCARLGELDDDLEFFAGLFDDEDPMETDSVEEASSTTSEAKTSAWRSLTPSKADHEQVGYKLKQRGDKSNLHSMGAATETGGWEAIAKRQKLQRIATERENVTLRAMLDDHERTARRIVKLTQKAVILASQRGIVAPREIGPTGYLGPASSDLTGIMGDLDAFAREANELMTPSTSETTELQVLAIQNRIVTTPRGPAVEATMEVAWVLPFDVDAISASLLSNSIRLFAKKEYRDATTLHESAQLKVVEAVTRTKEKNGLLLSKHGRLATRCEPRRSSDGSTRVLMVARGGLVVNSTLMVSVDGDSCMLVRAVPGHDVASLGPLSRIQWYRRFRSQPLAAANLSDEDRARWIHSSTSKLAREADSQVDKVTKAMENLVLTSTLLV